MSKIRIELNLAGINEIMKSKEMQDILQEAGNAIASQASGMDGAEYAASTHLASYVAIANVFPNSKKAAHLNFKKNTLLKAIGKAGFPKSKNAARRLK